MKFIFCIFFNIIFIFFPLAVLAAPSSCNLSGFNPGAQTLIIPSNAAVGDNLGGPVAGSFTYTCVFMTSATTIRYSPSLVLSSLAGIWDSTVPGIGLKVTRNSVSSLVLSNIGGPLVNNSSLPNLTGVTFQTTDKSTYTLDISIQMVKTGPIPPSPSKTVNLFGAFPVNSTNQIGGQAGSVSFTLPAITSSSCNVTTPSISMTMPTLSSGAFPSIGDTAGTQLFNLGINCSALSNVSITLTDATTPANSSTTLSLSPSSTASGIGYQILDQFSNFLTFSSSTTAGNPGQTVLGNVNGNVLIPMGVRYIRTGTVSPGSANASATFTMLYQ